MATLFAVIVEIENHCIDKHKIIFKAKENVCFLLWRQSFHEAQTEIISAEVHVYDVSLEVGGNMMMKTNFICSNMGQWIIKLNLYFTLIQLKKKEFWNTIFFVENSYAHQGCN